MLAVEVSMTFSLPELQKLRQLADSNSMSVSDMAYKLIVDGCSAVKDDDIEKAT